MICVTPFLLMALIDRVLCRSLVAHFTKNVVLFIGSQGARHLLHRAGKWALGSLEGPRAPIHIADTPMADWIPVQAKSKIFLPLAIRTVRDKSVFKRNESRTEPIGSSKSLGFRPVDARLEDRCYARQRFLA